MDTSTSARLSTGWGHARRTERELAHRSAFVRGPYVHGESVENDRLGTSPLGRLTVFETPYLG